MLKIGIFSEREETVYREKLRKEKEHSLALKPSESFEVGEPQMTILSFTKTRMSATDEYMWTSFSQSPRLFWEQKKSSAGL